MAIRPAVATLFMTAAVWYLRGTFLLIPIVAGIVVYGILLIVLGGITAEDRAYFRQLFDFKPAA